MFTHSLPHFGQLVEVNLNFVFKMMSFALNMMHFAL